MNYYEALEKLNDLRQRGVITEEEFQAEKSKLLSANQNQVNNGYIWGMVPETYCMLMHLCFLLVSSGIGLVGFLVLWIANKDQYPIVDQHGKNIANWGLSVVLYLICSIPLTFVLVGFFFMGALAVLVLIFGIIGAVKANQGEVWEYPLSIKFFR
jgi:uncharacterized Tic20 family protein